LRLQTMAEVARSHGLNIMGTSNLRSRVQVQGSDPFTFQNFLSKFETLRLFYRSPEVIGRVTREAIEDAAHDNVRYMELRFTPVALSVSQGFPLPEVIDWVIQHTADASREFGVVTRLIISMNRHESLKIAEQVVELAIERLNKGICGLDLAGNEAEFSARPFSDLFRQAHGAGLNITVHAGEWGGAANIAEALVFLNAQRIGHGVRVFEDPAVVDMARTLQPVFEVCVTSNYQSGVVPVLSDHPFSRMLSADLNATINTDDPSVSGISLSDEYRIVHETLGLSLDTLLDRILAALKAGFLPADEKAELEQRIRRDFTQALKDFKLA